MEGKVTPPQRKMRFAGLAIHGPKMSKPLEAVLQLCSQVDYEVEKHSLVVKKVMWSKHFFLNRTLAHVVKWCGHIISHMVCKKNIWIE